MLTISELSCLPGQIFVHIFSFGGMAGRERLKNLKSGSSLGAVHGALLWCQGLTMVRHTCYSLNSLSDPRHRGSQDSFPGTG